MGRESIAPRNVLQKASSDMVVVVEWFKSRWKLSVPGVMSSEI